MFNAMSKAIFGSENVDIAEWQGNVYPLPATMAKLVLPDETDNGTIANPSLLDKVSTERRIKLFEFGLWAERMVEKGKYASLSDVIKEELAIYESEGFGLRGNFQAKNFSAEKYFTGSRNCLLLLLKCFFWPCLAVD